MSSSATHSVFRRPAEYRVCRKCDRKLPLAKSFYKSGSGLDGTPSAYRTTCRECETARVRSKYIALPRGSLLRKEERAKERQRGRFHNLKGAELELAKLRESPHG